MNNEDIHLSKTLQPNISSTPSSNSSSSVGGNLDSASTPTSSTLPKKRNDIPAPLVRLVRLWMVELTPRKSSQKIVN